jgi:SulP family sulfate permease
MPPTRDWAGEILGGLAAMLVALPSAIAFGLVVYAPLGPGHAAEGALAGILGTIALGMIAPAFGASPRLVSAPCAPAAAVLAAWVVEMARAKNGASAEAIPVLLMLIALAAGLMQAAFGWAGWGRLIKFIPYPVVAGYLSGVGAIIIFGQLPKFLGLAKGSALGSAILDPSAWNPTAFAVGGVSMVVMYFAPKIVQRVPAPIVALSGGVATYLLFALQEPALATTEANPLLIGPIGGGLGEVASSFGRRWGSLGALTLENLRLVAAPAVTLAVLLSIDTLKTCVLLTALTRHRASADRDLVGQGLGNLASGLCGGIPGAGTTGATLINLNSGGKTRLSGFAMGVFALLAFVLFGRWVAWVPLASLAGILLVVGFRMIDWSSLRLLRSRATVFDFVVIAAVVATAVGWSLIVASGVGVGLAILLFLRDQIRGNVVRRKRTGAQVRSKRRRLPAESEVLDEHGRNTAILELQGSLFFGTTDQFSQELESFLPGARFVILDLRRVQSVDFSGTHLLELLAARLEEKKGTLVLSNTNLDRYFREIGLTTHRKNVRVVENLDAAVEWVEDRILEEKGPSVPDDAVVLPLSGIDVLSQLPPAALKLLESCVEERSFSAGQTIFREGERSDELYLIRRGEIRIELPINQGKRFHLVTIGLGDFFGDMAFLDHEPRSADAVAATSVDLYAVSRSRFDNAAARDPTLGGQVFSHLARVLALRLRQADAQVRALEEA